MTNYAEIVTRSAWLWTEFGADYAERVIPEKIMSDLPRYVRGKKKGKIKDHKIVWDKVERGGWVGIGRASNNGVENRVGKVIRVRLVHSSWGRPEEVVVEYEPDDNGKFEKGETNDS